MKTNQHKTFDFVMEIYEPNRCFELFESIHNNLRIWKCEQTVYVTMRVGNIVVVRGNTNRTTKNKIERFVDQFQTR